MIDHRRWRRNRMTSRLAKSIVLWLGASILSGFAASFAFVVFGGVIWMIAGLHNGLATAVMDGLVTITLLLYLSPIVLGCFLLGSLVFGPPAFLVLRRLGRSGPVASACAGGFFAGLAALVFLGVFGPLAVAPIPLAGAVGGWIFRAVVEDIPKQLA
ncbi:hypothetical protein [Brevundimonas vesicularis]|uniref:hypothetical protein n=1 Tax=Brevundimonas vesicularis TaxID=41276 RepID=UPI00384C6777